MIKHIVYASDNQYIDLMLVSMYSVIKNNQFLRKCKFHVLGNSLSKQSIDDIKRFGLKENVNIEVINVEEKLSKIGWIKKLGNSISTYARLFIPELIDTTDNIAYFDCDVICNGRLEELLNIDLQDYCIAGVLDPISTDARIQIALSPYESYINAGVLLLNNLYLRRIDFTNQAVKCIQDYNGNIAYHDQGVINKILRDKILFIEPKYNATSQYFIGNLNKLVKYKYFNVFYTAEQIKEAAENPVLIHFTGIYYARPWEDRCIHPLKDVYEIYAKEVIGEIKITIIKRSLSYQFLAFLYSKCPFLVYKVFYQIRLIIKHRKDVA